MIAIYVNAGFDNLPSECSGSLCLASLFSISVATRTKSITAPSKRLNQAPSICVPQIAPSMLPGTRHSERKILSRKFWAPDFKKAIDAVKDWTTILILLVPLAAGPSNPKKRSAGTDSRDPPPAITLIKPAAAPATASKQYS